jgi:hypothetical protein
MKPSVVANSLRRIASALSNSKNPSRKLVARDLKKILAAISSKEMEVWQFLYGRTIPYSTSEDADAEDRAGSLLFWDAFEELGMVDWSPVTDPKPIFQKTREIAQRLVAKGLHVDPEGQVKVAEDNWNNYKNEFMQEDIKKLVSAGIITADEVIN